MPYLLAATFQVKIIDGHNTLFIIMELYSILPECMNWFLQNCEN